MIKVQNPPNDRLTPELLHDLRTPINQIIGYAEMLAEQAEEDGQPAFVPDLKKIGIAGRQLIALLHDGAKPSPVESLDTGLPAVVLQDSNQPEPLTQAPNQALILVVDDDKMNREVLVRRLEKQGYATATAENGR